MTSSLISEATHSQEEGRKKHFHKLKREKKATLVPSTVTPLPADIKGHIILSCSRIVLTIWTAKALRSLGMPGTVASMRAKSVANKVRTAWPLAEETSKNGNPCISDHASKRASAI